MDYTLGGTIGLNTLSRIFLPNFQNVTITFILFPDDIPEGTETFRVSFSAQKGFPTYETPTFTSAVISILDNDCEYH